MTDFSRLSRTELGKLFSEFIHPDYVITDTETQKPYECDGLSMYCEPPLVTVLPETVAQIKKLMQICYQHQIPVVARGAGTGLSAGAMPNRNGVLISLAKFDQILNIDPVARTATVQPGVRNLAISEAAAPYQLYYAPDPSSQIACTIGGNIAENSGGVHCLKYGLTVHNVIKVKLITVDGEELTIGNYGPDNAGFDLLALINGSEGMLGIVTEITVKLLPIAEKAQMVLAAFDTVQAAANAVSRVIAAGIIPAALEMMDRLAIQAAEDFCSAGYPKEAEALLLCEIDGSEQEVQQHISSVEKLFRQLGATSIQISQNEQQRALFWKGRKSAFPAVGRISPDYYCMD